MNSFWVITPGNIIIQGLLHSISKDIINYFNVMNHQFKVKELHGNQSNVLYPLTRPPGIIDYTTTTPTQLHFRNSACPLIPPLSSSMTNPPAKKCRIIKRRCRVDGGASPVTCFLSRRV